MKYKTKAILSLAITASILSTLLPSSTHAMMNESVESNIHNSGYTLRFSGLKQQYYVHLSKDDTVADIRRLFMEKYGLDDLNFWAKKSKISDNMTVNEIHKEYGDHIYLNSPETRTVYETETLGNSASTNSFGSLIPEYLLLPNLRAPKIQKKPIKKEKKVTETKEDPSQFNPEIVKQVRKLLDNPNDKQELIRRLNALKIISLEKPSQKDRTDDMIKEIIQFEKRLIPEHKNLCLQLKDKFSVSYFTAVQVLYISDFNELKAQRLLRQFGAEPCF